VLKNGVVYIAPGGTHIAIKKSGASHVISFNDMPPISGLKPCANIMFDSLTSSNYDEVVCVVLTGMGADGTNGILSLGKSKPIYVIAQDEKSSVVYGMPRAIYEAGVVDEVVTLSDVAKAITKNVGVK
jgi:two-component system chemotaxis response regulator CheB